MIVRLGVFVNVFSRFANFLFLFSSWLPLHLVVTSRDTTMLPFPPTRRRCLQVAWYVLFNHFPLLFVCPSYSFLYPRIPLTHMTQVQPPLVVSCAYSSWIHKWNGELHLFRRGNTILLHSRRPPFIFLLVLFANICSIGS